MNAQTPPSSWPNKWQHPTTKPYTAEVQLIHIPPGTRFGKLTVIKRGENIGKNRSLLVECDCGTFKTVQARYLRSGTTTSCGCARTNTANSGIKSSHPLYQIWKNMHGRCYNRKHGGYSGCGGLGIKVCERWHNFAVFISDMGERPPKTQLVRVKPMQDYTPENTRWLTPMKKRAVQIEHATAA